jgi:hypothetical protein
MLDEANEFHPNIKLVPDIGTSVSFLDLFIENKNNIPATRDVHRGSINRKTNATLLEKMFEVS